jgi:hypothetical protein
MIIRQDIAKKQPGESWDAYSTRLYTSLQEGEIGNGYRRRGQALEHVGDNLEWLADFDAEFARLTGVST